MPRTSYIGQIKDGKLYLTEPKRKQMAADISRLREGRYVELEVRPLPRRSLPQNAFYWGVVISEIMHALQDLGHEVNAELTHEFLKGKFNAKPLCNKDGELIGEVGESTTLMNVVQFGEYISKIQQWAATYLSLDIPNPGQQTELMLITPSEGCVIVERG